jgi:excisionase family DNA binding protein
MSKNKLPGDTDVRCYNDAIAARLLGCSRRHVSFLRESGQLPFGKSGRRVMIRHCDLKNYIDSCMIGATQDAA